MRQVAHTVLAVLCIASLLDISWIGLQVYAWAKMAQDRPEDVGWSQAIVEAIEGEDPCDVCLYIQSERGKEKEGKHASDLDYSPRQPMNLSTAVCVKPAVFIGAAVHFMHEDSRAVRVECPPVPPPKAA